MQELDPCRKLTLLKPEGTQHVGKPKLRWLESAEEDAKEHGDVSSRTENSGGQFWKRLRFTKGCKARRSTS